MRIVQVTQFYFPWLGYQEFYLARELSRLGHDVLVVTSDLRWSPDELSRAHASTEDQRLPRGMSHDGDIQCVRLPTVGVVRGRLILRGVGTAIRSFRPDVVHAHNYLLPLTAQAAAAIDPQRTRFVVDEHQLPYQAKSGPAHSAQRRISAAIARRWLLPRIDALIPVAHGARDWLIEGYGCPPERVGRTIPLGADLDRFRPDADLRARGRAELHLRDDDVVLLSTGKIAPHKRLDLLVSAAAELANPHVVVVLVGNATPETALALQAQASHAGVRLHIAPAVPHDALARVLNAADVCVWPADCTISHLEAAACGRPIVIPDETAIADRIAGGNGLAARTGDVTALSHQLRELVDDPALRSAMGSAGRTLMLTSYSWPAIARQFVEVYERA